MTETEGRAQQAILDEMGQIVSSDKMRDPNLYETQATSFRRTVLISLMVASGFALVSSLQIQTDPSVDEKFKQLGLWVGLWMSISLFLSFSTLLLLVIYSSSKLRSLSAENTFYALSKFSHKQAALFALKVERDETAISESEIAGHNDLMSKLDIAKEYQGNIATVSLRNARIVEIPIMLAFISAMFFFFVGVVTPIISMFMYDYF